MRCFSDIVDGLVHLYYGIVLFKSHIIKVESAEVFSILFVMMDGIYSLFSKFIWLCPLWEYSKSNNYSSKQTFKRLETNPVKGKEV